MIGQLNGCSQYCMEYLMKKHFKKSNLTPIILISPFVKDFSNSNKSTYNVYLWLHQIEKQDQS